MSGEIQTKRRKEKKKKKENGSEEAIIPPPQPPPLTAKKTPAATLTDDMTIHVQKESVIGGGYCAKFVFIVILAGIAAFLGILITEPQRLNDLSLTEQSSQISQYLVEWMDISFVKKIQEDDAIDENISYVNQDDRDEEVEQGETEDVDDDDGSNEDKSEEEENLFSENAEEQMEHSEENENDDEDEDEDNDDDDEYMEDDAESDKEENYIKEYEDNQVNDENDETAYDDEDTNSFGSEEINNSAESDSIEANDNDDLEIKETGDVDQDESEENFNELDTHSSQIDDEEPDGQSDDDKEKTDIAENEDDDILEEEDVQAKKDPDNSETDSDNPKMQSSNMVIKFGVGAALLIVARIVLVRKWRAAVDSLDDTGIDGKATVKDQHLPEYARRNTIVPPPVLEDIEQDIDSATQDDYEKDDEDGGKEDDDYDDEDERYSSNILQYKELQNTYFQHLRSEEADYARNNYENEPDPENTSNHDEDEDEDDEDYEEEDEEEEDGKNESESDDNKDDDEELLRRLEEKYGRVSSNNEQNPDDEESEDDEECDDEENEDDVSRTRKSTGDQTELPKEQSQSGYEFANITNTNDFTIREELDKATKLLKRDAAFALTQFEHLCKKQPYSPRSFYGKATALDILAERTKSNEQLQNAIELYHYTLNMPDIPLVLFAQVAERCMDRMRFRGLYNEAIEVNRMLIEKFPHILDYRNQLVINYLTTNRMLSAKQVLEECLKKWPQDGFALVHYGFVLKTFDNNLVQAVEYLKRGIASRMKGVIDGRFYFHLGDALTRLGRIEEAYKVYSEGASENLFPSAYQRSLYNVKGLTAKPWWSKSETKYSHFFNELERNWRTIRAEGLAVYAKSVYFKDESENLRNMGEWKQFELFSRGMRNEANCVRCPITCKIIETFSDARFCTRGQVKFSVMHPGTHIWPHCGPTNCRLRSHLGLLVPSNTFIRVGNETRSWKEGEILIFDDSFDHEVWHNGTDIRLVLIVDIWHPNLSNKLKRNLPAI